MQIASGSYKNIKQKMKERVIRYLKEVSMPKTPTEIGLALGKDYNSASSSVNAALKKLVLEGKVIRFKRGNKVTYKRLNIQEG